MRPISLTMQAFGSYGKKTTIDFTRPNQNLFLITGDTGSGKTTIFDAIVLLFTEQPVLPLIKRMVSFSRVNILVMIPCPMWS